MIAVFHLLMILENVVDPEDMRTCRILFENASMPCRRRISTRTRTGERERDEPCRIHGGSTEQFVRTSPGS